MGMTPGDPVPAPSGPGPAARPLDGLGVVVTRAPHQAEEMAALLEDRGARVLLFPTIRIVPPEDLEPLRRAAREAASYDWLLCTSINGVEALRRALEEEGIDPSSLSGLRVLAIGPATGEALEVIGLAPDVVPDEYVAEGVLDAVEGDVAAGTRILIPRAAEAREVLPEGLRDRGAVVDVVEAYRTLPAEAADADAFRRRLRAGEADVITFTASSTVRNYHDVMGTETGGATVAAIGPITAETARELGFHVEVMADEYTIPGLVEALERWVAGAGVEGRPEERTG